MEIHWNLDISLVQSITLEYHCESRVKNLWSLVSTILRKIFSSANIFIMKLSCKFFFTNRLRSSIFFIFFFLIKFHTLVVEVLEAALFLCPRDSRRPPPLSISIFPFRFYPGSYGTHEPTSILYEYSLQNKNVDGRNRDKWVYSLSKKYFERVILKGESKSFRFLTRLSWFLPRRQRHDIYFCRSIWRNKDLTIKIIYTPLECNGQRSCFAWTATKLWLELL